MITKHKEEVIQVLFDAVDELNQLLPEEQQLGKSADTVVFGESGKLDSLGLVNLIVVTEQKIEEKFGVDLSLADERTMSQKQTPFKTLGTLADYIALSFSEGRND